MKHDTAKSEPHLEHGSEVTLQRKGTRDADILLLLWQSYRASGNELDTLIDLSLSILQIRT